MDEGRHSHIETREDARDPDVPEAAGRAKSYVFAAAVVVALALGAFGSQVPDGIMVLGAVPFAFVLFVLVLLGVALFHGHTLQVALGGALVITIYTAVFAPGFAWPTEQAHPGLWGHLLHEGEHTLLNLGGLLLGFSLLAKFFEHSGVPDNLSRLLPRRPLLGAFTLLAVVWVISSFLDNIAAAMIGGVMARSAFREKVTVGYVAALVAASNAGGAWSVLGDTTTTMMWLDGVSPLAVLRAMVASAVALAICGLFGAVQQTRVQAIDPPTGETKPIDRVQVMIVVLILAGAIVANFLFTGPWAGFFAGGPWYGVWAAILVGSLLRRPTWGELPGAAKGALFLLSLVWCASLMPVRALPPASWSTAFGLGFVSAVFDNIPLTKLALEQSGYDWGIVAFSVGFGGSMIWFGSSAGVAISKDFPEARHTWRYLKEGWPVVLAYVVAFFTMLLALGWWPQPKRDESAPGVPAAQARDAATERASLHARGVAADANGPAQRRWR
ncbi:sodium/proton antiporter, NhaD family (TC 2.A.62) [Nannocystis exedens]|uniref:Sodium/proton antiporter, NhaD family (TC 2.A.62) n=1 Tax=Nannocystis exedens TaxID=54 RepID=A0A1I1Z8Q6_9BACT|nr:citrate transporter [Nannocystis exedens]PCC75097.1 citrate transporter [Nannocystis exedens]SFE28141.1 sodium/proton antiporter, NhaD family (TC 2.A.62) [Nannocystis exedens]